MYLDEKVPVPRADGKITVKKVGSAEYVYFETGRVYDPARKFNVPRRRLVGKLAGEGWILPNENYAKFFPRKAPKARNGRGEAQGRSACVRAGTFLVLRKIAEEKGLPGILEKLFGKRDAAMALDLAAYSVVCEDNAAQYFPDYGRSHPLFAPGMAIRSDAAVSAFYGGVTDEQSLGFVGEWNARRDKSERIWVSYDSTNKVSQAGDLEMVEFGRAKDGGCRPVFGVAIGWDKTHREPLFWEEYPGSVVDVSQLRWMLKKVRGLGYACVGFILDRGYFSRANVEAMDEGGHAFLLMVKGAKRLVRGLAERVRGTFEDRLDARCGRSGVYGTTVEAGLWEGDKRTRWIHVCHSASLEAAERAELEGQIDRAERWLDAHLGQAAPSEPWLRRHYALDVDRKTGRLKGWSRRADALENELRLCGCFALVSSEKMSAAEALALYKGRDPSEKLFRADKSHLGDRTLRVHSSEAAAGKNLTEFVALILRNRIHVALLDALGKMDKKPNWMNVPAAIRELEKIELVRLPDGVYRQDYALTATQKTILAAFGIDEADACAQLAALAPALATPPE